MDIKEGASQVLKDIMLEGVTDDSPMVEQDGQMYMKFDEITINPAGGIVGMRWKGQTLYTYKVPVHLDSLFISGLDAKIKMNIAGDNT